MPLISSSNSPISSSQQTHSHTFKKSSSRSKDDILSQLAQGIILEQKNQNSLHLRQITKKEMTAISETGAPQIKVFIQNGNIKTFGRVKSLETINEALIYHKMAKMNDPLLQHIPRFIGVLDCHGNSIDLEKETEENIHEKYRPAYLILEDLTREFKEGTVLDGNPKDFKFVKKPLLTNNDERLKHWHTIDNSVFNWIREKFFGLSGCAFAYQEATRDSWFLWITSLFKRFLTVANTKSVLRNQFMKMGEEELQTNIQKLKDFKSHLSQSEFTFSDSSLLFIPVKKMVNGVEKRDIEIRLIDLCHGMSKDENIEGFDQMKNEMVDSIQELIDLMVSIANQRGSGRI